MGIFKALASEVESRWAVVRNRDGKPGAMRRVFALLELICFPVSLFTLLSVPLQYALVKIGIGDWIPDAWNRYLLPVLLAGAVGYLTNWLALMMLFRPFEPIKWLLIWPQGMIPRNKPEVARAVGEQVGTKLLSPEKIAAELSERIVAYMRRPDVIAGFRESAQSYLLSHQEEIITFLVPVVEETLISHIDKLVTPEKIQRLWNEEILPWLDNEDNRQKIANGLVAFFRDNSGTFSQMIRERVRQYINQRISSIPFIGNLGGIVSDLLVDFFADEARVKNMLSEWLAEPETRKMLEEKLSGIRERLSSWLNSPQGDQKLSEISAVSREKLKKAISDYLHNAFPSTVRKTLGSEKLWNWLESSFLPSATLKLSEYITEHRQTIVENLRLSERIEAAINHQDVRQFYRMINEIAAQHLGAIQVLGFILGSLVGVLQLFQSSMLH